MGWLWWVGGALAADEPADQAQGEFGGGGIVLHDERLSHYYPGGTTVLDQTLGCVGGQGFGAARGIRQGGEGHFCVGSRGVLALGGPQVGIITAGSGFYASLHAAGGLGWYGAGEDVEYSALLAFLKPTAAVAWAPGPFAIELGAYVMLPLEVVAWSPDDRLLGPGRTHLGAQLAFMFGDFTPHDTDRVEISLPDDLEVQ
jgi:hypothetical protein